MHPWNNSPRENPKSTQAYLIELAFHQCRDFWLLLYLFSMDNPTKPTKDTFYNYINPVCLAVGVLGFALHFDMNMLDVGMWGLGGWAVTGALGLQKEEVVQ